MSHSCLAVARYLLERADASNRTLSPMKLIKLVYITHGWMLGLYGRPLIREDVEAWRYGPVIRELYQEVKQFRARPIPVDHIPPQADAIFDGLERSVMDQVHDIYGKRSAIQLSRMTHSPGTPWDIVYNQLGKDFVIPNDLIEDHYKALYERYGSAE